MGEQMVTLRVGLIGDFRPEVPAHQAIPRALVMAADAAGVEVEPVWLPTMQALAMPEPDLAAFAAFWCVPASPYQSMDGALRVIRLARERSVPFLGTCGGFQHALIEYARHVLGFSDADHMESNAGTAMPLISALSCSLVEVTGPIHLAPGSRIAAIYGVARTVEAFHCNYGLNPDYERLLAHGPLAITGRGDNGEARVVELAGHPFFIATLYQPERSALRGIAIR